MKGFVNKLKSRRQMAKYGKFALSLARFALFFALIFIIIYPLLQAISKAFMPVEQYADPSVIWIPKSLTWTNIQAAISGMEYWTTLGYTVFFCMVNAVFQVTSCAVVGYGFARFRFPFKGVLFALVVLTIVVPSQLIFIPLMMQYRFFDFFGISRLLGMFTNVDYSNYTVNLLNSEWTFFMPSLLGVGVRSGLFIYIYRQCFRNMPKELEEAAKIDGCGPLRTFTRVMLPNAKASALTVFLFSIVWHWNETMMQRAFMPTKRTLAVAMQQITASIDSLVDAGFYEAQGRNLMAARGAAYASLILFLLPPLILYIFTQRYFVEGVESSGIKG